MTEIALRSATLPDVPALGLIKRAAIDAIGEGPYSASELSAWRDGPACDLIALVGAGRYLVAERGGVLLGGAGWEEEGPRGSATIRAVFVHPLAHGQGVGGRLIRAIEAALAARGIGVLAVPAALNAIGFYRRLGYRSVERREAELGGVRLPYERMLKVAA